MFLIKIIITFYYSTEDFLKEINLYNQIDIGKCGTIGLAEMENFCESSGNL